MKRFILLTFGFLGLSFYELSGGADYAPRPEFAQADVAQENEPDLVENEVSRLAFVDNTSVAIKGAPKTSDAALEAAVLAAIKTPLVSNAVAAVETVEPVVTEQRVSVTLPVAKPVVEEETVAVAEPVDLRAVAGNRVNLRDGPGKDFAVVTRLSKGTTIMVLEDAGNGWVQLQVVPGGAVGWMADWLLTKDG